MQRMRLSALVLTGLLLAACGSSNDNNSSFASTAPNTKGTFKALVSFGDSLSDIGTYTPATGALGTQGFGGKFTTNPGPIWTEVVASKLGLSLTPHQVGFNAQAVTCPAAAAGPAAAATCTAHGQGGARVTNPAGIGRNPDGSGALTVPLKQQIANHLARFGKFTENDLVVVWGGNNDVFTQFGAISAKVAAGVPQATAVTEAQVAMKQAAQELATYVKNDILAKGAKYVLVINLPDSSRAPLGATLTADQRFLLSGLVQIFNDWIKIELNGQPVQLLDAYAANDEVLSNLNKYGFVNSTSRICDVAKIAAVTQNAVTDGSSLFCGAPATLADGANVTTWLFADSVHPSTGFHKVLADIIYTKMQSYGWL